MYTIAKPVLIALQCYLIKQPQPVLELRYCFQSEVLGSGRKCSKSGLNNTKGIGRNITIQPNQYGIPNLVNTTVDCSVEPFLTHHLKKAIAQLYKLVAVVTNKVALQSRKNTVCNGLHLISKLLQEKDMVSKIFKTCCGDLS